MSTKKKPAAKKKVARKKQRSVRLPKYSFYPGFMPYWHIHHSVLFEMPYEPIEERTENIAQFKPERERALRHRLMQPMKNFIGNHGLYTSAYYAKGRHEIMEAKYNDLAKSLDKEPGSEREKKMFEVIKLASSQMRSAAKDAIAQYMASITLRAAKALHAKECEKCPWDGKTILHRTKKGIFY